MFKETMTVLAITAGLIASGAAADGDAPRMQERFEQIDTDGDGQITAEEIEARAAARFVAADADGDGALTQEEMMNAASQRQKERLLMRFDTDGNGALSAAELDAMGTGTRAGKRMARMFERMDADDSGALSADEMRGGHDAARMIAKLDANDDGSLSVEEFAKAGGHRMGHGRHGNRDRD